MDLATLDSLDRETLIRLILSQAEIIERLTRRVAELEAKLDLPKKTPDNSSTPPSKGQKPSASAAGKDEGSAGTESIRRPTVTSGESTAVNLEAPGMPPHDFGSEPKS